MLQQRFLRTDSESTMSSDMEGGISDVELTHTPRGRRMIGTQTTLDGTTLEDMLYFLLQEKDLSSSFRGRLSNLLGLEGDEEQAASTHTVTHTHPSQCPTSLTSTTIAWL